MKSKTRLTSKGQIVIPKPVREQLRKAGNPIDILYGCLKDLPRDPLGNLEAEHQAEIEADQRRRQGGAPSLLR